MKNAWVLALVYGLSLCASGAPARKQVSWDDVTFEFSSGARGEE